MPELPEVETTLRGIRPHVVGRRIAAVSVRERRLRQPVSPALGSLEGGAIAALRRRAKYLLAELAGGGHLLIHLGMSGSLRICHRHEPLRRHDHVVIEFADRSQLRFHDPRRFGLVLMLGAGDPERHPLLACLGPEPLGDEFDGAALHARCRVRRAAIKAVIMDSKVVAGVGNIYASEALFRAGICPGTRAARLTRPRCRRLASAIRDVLEAAVTQGGTTLRDFLDASGNPGYFRQQLAVYQRAGLPCRSCRTTIRQRVIAQRASYWCPRCQR
mgnify:CR=1 FL=1